MFPCCDGLRDELWLDYNWKGDDNGVDVGALQEIGVAFAWSCIVGVDINVCETDDEFLGRGELPRVDGA